MISDGIYLSLIAQQISGQNIKISTKKQNFHYLSNLKQAKDVFLSNGIPEG